MILSLIVAVSDNDVIGGHNRLLWHLASDFRRMKEITMGHPLIMGRKTHESIGRALPGRRNIVITRKKGVAYPGCEVVASLQEALESVKNEPEAFIFGGGEIYRESLPFVQKMYLTRVHATVQGDTVFPEVDWSQWKEVRHEECPASDEDEYASTFGVFERKK